MKPFLEAIDERVLVCDGAMGAMLYARGIFVNRSFEEANLSQPDLVAGIHRDYIAAGSDVVETNTFGANRVRLANFGLAERMVEINERGAAIAKQAASDRAWVAGSIGPLGVRIEPWGRTSVEEARVEFRDQARALAKGGVDLFILETFQDLAELLCAIRAVREVSDLPIVAEVTTGEDGHAWDGTPPEVFAPALEQSGADVIGVNCSVGPAAMLETVEAMARVTSARLVAQPNAGLPRDVDGRRLSLSSPEYMASYARRFVTAGVRLVGGCCGTTPDHIRRIADAVRSTRPAVRVTPVVGAEGPAAMVAPIDRREKSAMARALAEGRFVTLGEVASPRGLDLTAAIEQARRFRDLGAEAVNIPDYPQSGARVSALAVAVLIAQSQSEPLLQYTCRERTLVTMQSDLSGAHALGIRNILLTTGRSQGLTHFAAPPVSGEVDAIGLINMAARLNRGLDLGGRTIGRPTAFHIGAAFNPFAADMDLEWRRLAHKIDAGAEFVVTPPILDVEAFERVLPGLLAAGVPVIAGAAALESLRHAEFLASEVVGVRVAPELLQRLAQATDEADAAAEMSFEIARRLERQVHGVQVTSFRGSAGAAERLLRALRDARVASPRHETRSGG